jgi:tetratricopeptide (TPR) repeat protein
MKKFISISLTMVLSMLILAGNIQAQKKYVTKALDWAEKGEYLDTALVLLDMALENEKTKDWAKTYYAKGMVYKAAATSENEEFKKLSEYPLLDATNNFETALTARGVASIQTILEIAMLNLPNEIINSAVTYYNDENYKAAFVFFKKAYELKKLELYGAETDTAIIYNTALMAQRSEDFDNAIKYYNMAVELNYGAGDTYVLLADAHKQSGDTASYVKSLKSGFEKYPENQSLLGTLTNYFLIESDNPKEAIEYLDLAISKDPSNSRLFSGKAMFYDQMGDTEKSITNYKKAIELDNEFFEAQFNLGVLYFNQGIALTNVANEIKANDLYAIAKEKADNKFKESIPFLERAYELNKEDKSLANTLSQLYYRLQMDDKYEAINKEINNF